MTDSRETGIKGYIQGGSFNFRDGKFAPINANYATFRPSEDVPSNAIEAYLPPLLPGEFYTVSGDIDMSEGRGGLYTVGNFIEYRDAYRASFGVGAQGSIGYVSIQDPGKPKDITALDRNGETIIIATIPTYRGVSISDRLQFPQGLPSGTH